MKNLKIALLIVLTAPFLVNAKGSEGLTKNVNKQDRIGLAAGCTPASKIIFLEFNNVRTRVEAGGLWWQDRANGIADYEVPVGSRHYALYAGGLWLAGTDVNGQLKAAASLFGRGVDFWAGPLDTMGLAEIDDRTCLAYDKFFEISKADVGLFVAYNNAVANGTASEDFPDYQIPKSILEYPGNGDIARGEDLLLAPYVNVAGDITYEPELGDYPFFDLKGDVDCRADRKDRSESSTRPLFGDQTYWWVFNDKGNLHTETNAPSIGMEIHGQAFAFATNDAINDMTFYNFELINRSTFTLTDTYFASYVDPDLGDAFDDYVGCDVERGLGFCYNGADVDRDRGAVVGYGSTPAAIGIDFFEGPYQDADDINNLVGIGPGEALNGLGYLDTAALEPDSVIDNERFGMRRFVYYEGGALSQANNGDPELAVHYYNYMRGIWKNGQRMVFGGNGFNSIGIQPNIPTDFMFPWDSDPLYWGTGGVKPNPDYAWSEDNPVTAGVNYTRPPGDRRFLQSAGPFTLEPGNVNDITVGVVFAQAESGGRLASVQKLFQADDKAQALFDNCFQVLNGPDAPLLTIQELNQELVFYITNPEVSNNGEERGEPYEENDPDIVTPRVLADSGVFYDSKYRFQGYQVYQLSGPGVSVNDIGNLEKARLVFQCDIKDGVEDLINYDFDEGLGANVPVRMVSAANDGIKRSFTVRRDLFAPLGSELVNFKTYYYIAIAYGYNEFKPYVQDEAPDSANPFSGASDGQTKPYISSRQAAGGGSVRVVTGIPHNPLYEEGGTIVNASYGDEIQITRLLGFGNGGKTLLPSQSSINRILEQKAWEDSTQLVGEIDYAVGQGPFDIRVIDPLNIVDGTFYMQILDTTGNAMGDTVLTDSATWRIWLDGTTDTVYSQNVIATESEQLLIDPKWGLSISIVNGDAPGSRVEGSGNGFISAELNFSNPDRPWLGSIPDTDLENPYNWIASGVFQQGGPEASDFFGVGLPVFNDNTSRTGVFYDPEQDYEGIVGGSVAPYQLTRYLYNTTNPITHNAPAYSRIDTDLSGLDKLSSMIIVITKDKTKWSRCVVVETNEDDYLLKNSYKRMLSVDKEGNPVDTTGLNLSTLDDIDAALSTDNPDDAGYISAVGMGWFPGYALNKETGERYNIAFGEDSKYPFNNGNDMIFNPTSVFQQGAGFTDYIWGGKHFVYVFRKTGEDEKADFTFQKPRLPRFEFFMPEYDGGKTLKEFLTVDASLTTPITPTAKQYAWGSCSWVMVPRRNDEFPWLDNDLRLDINISAPFGIKDSELAERLDNNGYPVYRFVTKGLATQKNQTATLKEALEEINVVPNPYYAISEYEASQLENTVKFTNLPTNCKITIYNSNGTLIRSYNKSDPSNFLDWNLKNDVGIPIASGVYIIHVEVPGVGEKILKWFGVVRPVDLNNF